MRLIMKCGKSWNGRVRELNRRLKYNCIEKIGRIDAKRKPDCLSRQAGREQTTLFKNVNKQ